MAKNKRQKLGLKEFLHTSFIPSWRNDHRPHAFRHFMLSAYSAILMLTHLSFGVAYIAPVAVNPVQLKTDVLTKINQERRVSSEVEIRENPQLKEAAEKKLKDMFSKNYWDHTSPAGEKAWVFINQEGYSYTSAGENLARGFTTADDMVNAWMNSPTHKRNILDKSFTETGIAIGNGVINGKQTTVAVQLFGAPSSAYTQGNTMVAGEKSVSPSFSLANPLARISYFVVFIAIFALVVFDGTMIRLNKTHKNKRHMLAFRTSLGLNILALAILCLNLTQIW